VTDSDTSAEDTWDDSDLLDPETLALLNDDDPAGDADEDRGMSDADFAAFCARRPTRAPQVDPRPF
jgi:hypothetical protein